MTERAADRLTDLLELRRTSLFDIDSEHRLLVGNDDTGSTQLYEVSPDGQWRQLTHLGEPCSGRYLPGERVVVLSADTGGTERAQLSLLRLDTTGSEQRLPTPEPLVHDPAFIHDLLEVQPGRVIYSTNRRNGVDFDVIARDVATGEERVLWDGGGWFNGARVSPDGRWVVLSRMTTLPASSQLLLVDSQDGTSAAITDDEVPGEWANPRWLPDSSALLASSDAEGVQAASDAEGVQADRDAEGVQAAEGAGVADNGTGFVSLRRFDVAHRTWSMVAGTEGSDVYGWPSPDGNRIAVVSSSDGADSLEVRSPDATVGHPIALPHAGVLTFRTNLIWSPDSSELGMTFSSPVQPPEAYSWRGGESVNRRTTGNPAEATADLIEPRSFRAPALDGEQIPTFAIIPPNAAGSAVMIIHGGPESATVRSWNPMAAALALAGYTVVLPNVRGSAGYGRRWLSLDDVEKRLDSVADLVALREWLPAIGVDQSRIALYGGSYGGYMVLAGLTFYPDLWAAGVDIVGMSSLVTFLQNTSAYRRVYREREYGRLKEDYDVLQAASPLPIIDRITAPLFVIHGANDPRVPLSEAEQVAAAVRSSGAECELLVYADEGHGLAKRVNQLDAYPQALEFLARHLS